jgi:multicomponent Na+:H+ antiporter subunit G
VTGALLLVGALLMLLAALGIVRLPDVYSRMSATSKSATLGVALALLGAAWHFGSAREAGQALVTALFVYLTTPIAAHRIARAAWKSGVRPWSGTRTDELGPPPEEEDAADGPPPGAGG